MIAATSRSVADIFNIVWKFCFVMVEQSHDLVTWRIGQNQANHFKGKIILRTESVFCHNLNIFE